MFKKGYFFIILIFSSFLVSFTGYSSQLSDVEISVDLEPKAIGLSETWSFTTGGPIITSPAFIDQNGDLDLEIVFGSYDDYIYCISNTGAEVWKYQTGANVVASPAVADLNKDGSMDVLVASTDGYVYCLDVNGALIWKAGIGTAISNDPVVVDLDFDGNYEILISDSVDTLYCVDYLGVSLWNLTYTNYYGGEPLVCDYTGTEELEIILPTSAGPIYFTHEGVYLDTSSMLFGFSRPIIADLNRSGISQLLFYEDTDTLKCTNVSDTADVYWQITNLSDNSIISTPVVVDIDSDGALEIIVLATKPGMHIFAGQGILYCINSSGSIVWSEAWLFFGSSQPLVSDIDNDGNMEIITVDSYADQDRIYFYDYLGSPIFEFTSTGAIANSPLVIDIDDDDIVEFLCPSSNGKLYCAELSDVTSSGRTLWSREKCSTFNIGQVDFDGDHIDDLSEAFYGIDPELIDSDTDGLIDWQEIYSLSTDPANSDSDSDGINDGDELVIGTDPLDGDSDDDSILDGEEVEDGVDGYTTDPLAADTDGDGFDDPDEIAAGTDPTDPDDYPVEETPTPTPTNTTTPTQDKTAP
ncbi:MAG: FG-GAP-like repeat-containing protein [Candidatus Heimdallarchaeota archaeon]